MFLKQILLAVNRVNFGLETFALTKIINAHVMNNGAHNAPLTALAYIWYHLLHRVHSTR